MPSRVNDDTAKAKDAQGRESSIDRNGGKEDTEESEPQSCVHHWEKESHVRDCIKRYEDFQKNDRRSNDDKSMEDLSKEDEEARSSEDVDQESTQTKKRGGGVNQGGPSKKQKNDSQAESQGTAGDMTRVPRTGQTVHWKTIQGLVEGKVVEVVYEEKTVEGKSIKGSKGDPRGLLQSSSSGKYAVHKPEAVYFD